MCHSQSDLGSHFSPDSLFHKGKGEWLLEMKVSVAQQEPTVFGFLVQYSFTVSGCHCFKTVSLDCLENKQVEV